MIALRTRISPCPPAGEGVHQWLACAAWQCRRAGMKPEDACAVLHGGITRPPRPANEVESAVAMAFRSSVSATHNCLRRKAQHPRPKWPKPNAEQIEAVAAGGDTMADLWEISPVRLEGAESQTAAVLRLLFPGDPLLCVGCATNFFTARLSTFVDRAHKLPQIVPSPMTAKEGRTKLGKVSQHTLEATGARRFIVVEGDQLNGVVIPKSTQAAVLLHLARRVPLALVVDSGGKSLHGWFFCAGVAEEKVRQFYECAVTLGADPALWTRSQFARMPDGLRDTGARQPVLFFNPSVLS